MQALAESRVGALVIGHKTYNAIPASQFIPEWIGLGLVLEEGTIHRLYKALMDRLKLGYLWDVVVEVVVTSAGAGGLVGVVETMEDSAITDAEESNLETWLDLRSRCGLRLVCGTC